MVALIALLPGEFPGEAAAINFHHYEPRCAHTYHGLRRKHVDTYLEEFVFRYNRPFLLSARLV